MYRDPIHDGAADPVVIRNETTDEWWMIYTARRANLSLPPDNSWIHGTALGVATSSDGENWLYRGTLEGLDIEPGHHTYWAPEVVGADGSYHMYVSVIRGVPAQWQGHERHIRHYTSDDLWQWEYRSTLDLSSRFVIDACVVALPSGGWRLWYKDEADGAQTWAADSADLFDWTVTGRVVSGPPHEGPNVFELGGTWWMLVDEWNGQRVLRSGDLENWTDAGRILEGSSSRPDDIGPGLHADVVVRGDDAIVYYFTHPEWDRDGDPSSRAARRTTIHSAVLAVEDGQLTCSRDVTGFQPPTR